MGYDIEKEKREAIEAGRRALNSLQAAKENLNSAKNWGLVVICPLSSRQVKYLKVSDKNTYISFWSVGIFMHTISLYIF